MGNPFTKPFNDYGKLNYTLVCLHVHVDVHVSIPIVVYQAYFALLVHLTELITLKECCLRIHVVLRCFAF